MNRNKPAKAKRRKAIVLFDLDSDDEEQEISVQEGEQVTILRTLDRGWLLGRNSSGNVGKVPAAVLRYVDDDASTLSLPQPEDQAPDSASEPPRQTGQNAKPVGGTVDTNAQGSELTTDTPALDGTQDEQTSQPKQADEENVQTQRDGSQFQVQPDDTQPTGADRENDPPPPEGRVENEDFDADYKLALELSKAQEIEDARRRQTKSDSQANDDSDLAKAISANLFETTLTDRRLYFSRSSQEALNGETLHSGPLDQQELNNENQLPSAHSGPDVPEVGYSRDSSNEDVKQGRRGLENEQEVRVTTPTILTDSSGESAVPESAATAGVLTLLDQEAQDAEESALSAWAERYQAPPAQAPPESALEHEPFATRDDKEVVPGGNEAMKEADLSRASTVVTEDREATCGQCGVRIGGDCFCVLCEAAFCARCWDSQFIHRNKIGDGAPVHERTSVPLGKKIQNVFKIAPTENREVLFKEDAETAWFGVVREEGALPAFQDYGRYSNLIASTRKAPKTMYHLRPQGDQERGQDSRRYPSLVSFVGQTGAGKSSIIKLLIDLGITATHDFSTPIVGAVGSDSPTSDDVHLYLDPATVNTVCPLFYADCEGLEGGEREPIAAKFKQPTNRFNHMTVDALQKQRYTARRELSWSNDADTRSREYAVTHLYPRLLYTFSDVIVFILKNPKTIEGVLEKLVVWAASALEKSSNQPVLPHAIIVLNATKPVDLDASLWDIEQSTKEFFDKLARTVFNNRVFKRYAQFWRERDRRIDNAEDLLLSYYQSVKIVRVPTDERPSLIVGQINSLKDSISSACENARANKRELRMLLNDEELDPYLQYAFDHFADTLDTPFDFIQASYLNSPIPDDFSGNILKLAINMMALRPSSSAMQTFEDLSSMVASCIMFELARNKKLGLAEDTFPLYLEHINAALEEFANRHWPCEYVDKASGKRCVNVRSGHGSKGHQVSNGHILAVGDYQSPFSFEKYQTTFEANVYHKYKRLLDIVRQRAGSAAGEQQAAADIHHEKTLTKFFMKASDGQPWRLSNHTVCYTCLFESPEHVLPCGHIICTACAKSYGTTQSKGRFTLYYCPNEDRARPIVHHIDLKPEHAGVRLLSLDGGGVRGIVELAILQQIEHELDNKLPINMLFDMIVGTSTGGLIALGLGTQGWTVEKCQEMFQSLCSQAFTIRSGGGLPGVGWLINNHHHSKFRTRPLQEALIGAFTEHQNLFGGKVAPMILSQASDIPIPVHSAASSQRGSLKVAVVATSESGSSAVLANYNRYCIETLPYSFIRPEKPEAEIKVWEAARATSAAPKTFKPYHHEATRRVYLDGGIYYNNPIAITAKEGELAWPSTRISQPDIVLSLGTAFNPRNISEKPAESSSKPPRLGVASHLSSLLRIASDHVESSLNSEKTWITYKMGIQSKEMQRRFIRLNPALKRDPPKLDDVSEIPKLQREVRNIMRYEHKVEHVALQLLAALFYFDVEGSHGTLCVKGRIQCRLPRVNSDYRALSNVIASKASGGTACFKFREQGAEGWGLVSLGSKELRDMERNSEYASPLIKMDLSAQGASIEMLLCFSKTQQYPLSGLPRKPLQQTISNNRSSRAISVLMRTHSNRTMKDINEARKNWRPPSDAPIYWWSDGTSWARALGDYSDTSDPVPDRVKPPAVDEVVNALPSSTPRATLHFVPGYIGGTRYNVWVRVHMMNNTAEQCFCKPGLVPVQKLDHTFQPNVDGVELDCRSPQSDSEKAEFLEKHKRQQERVRHDLKFGPIHEDMRLSFMSLLFGCDDHTGYMIDEADVRRRAERSVDRLELTLDNPQRVREHLAV